MRAVDELLVEQIAYYCARADEYDDAYERRGRHDHGPEANAAWWASLAEARSAFDELPLDGARVLELAAGTGVWTEALVARGALVTAVDASGEVLERNRARLGARSSTVRYVEADVFSWRPEEAFDAVVFCFWISHVPVEYMDSFLAGVSEALRAGGWVFFVDGPPGAVMLSIAAATETDGVNRVDVRNLNDGREFRVVKNVLEAPELAAHFQRAGLDVTVHENAHFVFGSGRRA